jgi:hypothetical protein
MPVCLHVRRQDYLDTPAGRRLGFLGKGYYDRAVARMARRAPGAHFFIFSDDLAWCRKSLCLHHPHTYVEHRGTAHAAAASDFRLMTRCRHFIIANSSFSWWAAWLGESADSLVIAPRTWFRRHPRQSRDLAPARWPRI